MEKIRKYVAEKYGIDVSKLSDQDVKKLAEFYLLAMSLETPRMANIDRKDLGL